MMPRPQSAKAEVSPRPSNHTAKRPLPTSPIRQIAALHQLATLLTLRNPGFLDPTLVMSMPVPNMATLANGIAPIKNAARNFATRIIFFYGCALSGLAFAAAHFLTAAPGRACIRSRSFLDGCALSGLHSQPLMSPCNQSSEAMFCVRPYLNLVPHLL